MARPRKVTTPTSDDKHAFTSGATSSEQVLPFHLVPWPMTVGEAKRYGLGALKHGDVNYQKCITFSKDGRVKILDLEFARDRYNHLIEHLYIKLRKDGETEYNKSGLKENGSNLDAAAWGVSYLKWVSTHGFDWKRILNPHYVNEIQLAIPTDIDLRIKNPMYWVKTKDGRCFKYSQEK